MFDQIIVYLSSIHPVSAALLATLFTWSATALGASLVFFCKNLRRKWLDGMLGFTGGVMIAASVWSLIIPAIGHSTDEVMRGLSQIDGEVLELTFTQRFEVLIPIVLGILMGAIFISLLDKFLPHLHINFPTSESEGITTNWNKTTLLILAITLHNIPEGLAIGVLFGAAADLSGADATQIITAGTLLAIGIGIQNFPEGIAVAMPLRRAGVSRFKAFWFGQLSAIVEPIMGVIGALAVSFFEPLLPYSLAFAAGAMIFVVVEEVIPETQRDKYTDIATIGFVIGFIVMMSLDVALG